MIPIQQLLERFKNLPNTEKVKKEKIVEVFSKEKIPITIKQITLLRKSISIKSKPIIKTEILLKKADLLQQIQKSLGADIFTEIK